VKPALILIDHGSRRAEANAVLDDVAALVRRADPGRAVHTAHMELAPPSLADAVAACVAEGARDIIVVPWFLAPGQHSTRDIPRLADEAVAPHPNVRLRVASPLGAHAKLAELALLRADEV
jgi:sirohydrochlorin ferrochelatase